MALDQNTHNILIMAVAIVPIHQNSVDGVSLNNAKTNHELTGALVGGCKTADDNNNDSINDYFSNEITLDYDELLRSKLFRKSFQNNYMHFKLKVECPNV